MNADDHFFAALILAHHAHRAAAILLRADAHFANFSISSTTTCYGAILALALSRLPIRAGREMRLQQSRCVALASYLGDLFIGRRGTRIPESA